MAMAHDDGAEDLYAVLGVSRSATVVEVRRAYRNLLTKEHPDKGGDPERFAAIQRAYDILSADDRRRQYDATGTAEKTVDEEFMDSFGNGAFRDKMKEDEARREHLSEQITVRQSEENQSHTAGFEAWMRARGDAANMVYTADTMVEQFGVVKSSYEAVPLPPIRAYQVRCTSIGSPQESLEVVSEAIPAELEWGEVLVNIRAAPINPLDLHTVATGATSAAGAAAGEEGDTAAPPFVAGHDGLGVVVKVGPGVKNLAENDWVFPFKHSMGTWRSLAVWREKDVLKMPADLMPAEYASMMRELCVAYRLLEDYGNLRPGDAVMLNAATSTVGQVVIQLCTLLKLRTVAVVRDTADFEKTSAWLKSLGATEVLPDAGSLKLELDKKRFFAKPKLGLDAVGGHSAVRLADALAEGCPLVIYGCMSSRAPTWPWTAWVGRELRVFGFNLSRWMKTNKKRVPGMLEALAKLVNADKLTVNYTEYELSTEFQEALDHALEAGRNTKIVLKVNDIGVTY